MEHLMTSEEIAEILHVDPVTIRRLVMKGQLSAYRIGADYRFAPSDLQDYLQRQRITAHGQNESDTDPDHPLNPLAQFFGATVEEIEKRILHGKQATVSMHRDYRDRDKFNRFTKQARHVLTLAQEEAQSLQHGYVGTEHFLLGLVREVEGTAGQVLKSLGVEADQARRAVEAIVGHGEHSALGQGLTPRAKKVIELAVDEARRLNQKLVATEHLLLGLLREGQGTTDLGQGIAVKALESLGLDLEAVRTETLRVLGKLQQGQAGAPAVTGSAEAATLLTEDEKRLTCASCETRNPRFFRYCFNCGRQLVREEKSGEEK